GRDFGALPEGGPALDVDIRFEEAGCAYLDVGLDHAVLADADPRADDGVGVYARCGGDHGRSIDGHEVIWYGVWGVADAMIETYGLTHLALAVRDLERSL